MPLYLCDVVGTGRDLIHDGVDDPYRPAIGSTTIIPPWLDLRPDATIPGRGVIELPVAVVDPRLTLLGDAESERMAASARAALIGALSVAGDPLVIGGAPTLGEALAGIVTAGLPGARGRKPRPDTNGQTRVLLNGKSLGQPVQGLRVKHSQSHTESWPTNGTTITTGQDNAWTEPGSDMEVSSNRLRTDSTAAAIHNAVSGAGLLDTVDHRSSWDCAITSKAGTLQRLYMDARYTDNNNLYSARAGRETTNFRQLLKRVAAAQTVLGSDTTDPGATFTGEISANGSTIKFVYNGSDLFSVTDTSITTSALVSLVVITTAAVGDASYGAGIFRDMVNSTLTAAQASYTLSGQAATLTASRYLAAAQAAYALTGQAAGLLAGRLLTADQASFVLTGLDAALTKVVVLACDAGTFTLTGEDAGLVAARLLTAAPATFNLTGPDAQLVAARLLTASAGSFALTGADVTLLAGRYLGAGLGSFGLTGTSANLLASRVLAAGLGSFVLTGEDVTLTFHPASNIVPRIIIGPSAGDRSLAPSRGNATLGPAAGSSRTVPA